MSCGAKKQAPPVAIRTIERTLVAVTRDGDNGDDGGKPACFGDKVEGVMLRALITSEIKLNMVLIELYKYLTGSGYVIFL